MKTPFKLIVSALVLSLSVFAPSYGMVQDDHSPRKDFAFCMYPAADASKVWLNLERYQPDETVTLQLVNEKGHVLFQETLCGKDKRQAALHQKFDMSQLGDGHYTFRLSTRTQTEQMTFKLVTPTLEATMQRQLVAMN